MYDVAIIGGGPAGYVAGIRAGQLGLKTLLVEKQKVGGMCLNWGCIPTKALLESSRRFEEAKNLQKFGIDGVDSSALTFNWENAVKRSKRIVARLTKGVEFLLKKNKVELISGTAKIVSANQISVEETLYDVKNIVLATGSTPKDLSVDIPEDKVVDLKSLMTLSSIPERIVVEGENSHAVELAQFFNKIGKKVVFNVKGDRILPEVDTFLSDYMTKLLLKEKLEINLLSGIKGYEEGKLITDEKKIEFDLLVNASSRQAIIPESGVDLALNEKGFINVNERFQCSVSNIFAVGDVNGISGFAHSASAQGLNVINFIHGIKENYNNEDMPINIYSSPEMAQIGLTEERLKSENIDYKITEFPLSANGKALIEDKTNGLVRLLSETKYGEVLGIQIVSQNATDMISEAAVLKKLEGTVFDLAKAVHAHPTVSEVFMESGFAAFDQPIHK